jgi:uncharacterized membrane protein
VATVNSVILFTLLVFSIIGITDAGYLAYEHYTQGDIVCLITEGCDVVTTSEYSFILGVPVSLLGLVYYAMFFFGLLWLILKPSIFKINLLKILVGAGLLFSLWFVYVQIYLINAICFYCMVSATLTTLSFILLWLLKRDQLIKWG